ncbi:MAG TPA: DUF3500 domain-containing protein [Nitrolancea sp.]|nr:DUF3500 domain-containing protein [Nitrolancea sp.]
MAMETGIEARTLVERMGDAATKLLASLSTDQRAKAVLDFEDTDERSRWFYTPIRRKGLPLAEMDRPQQRLAHQLLASGLSRSAYYTASTIMGLENTLDAVEGWIFQTTRGVTPERVAGNYGRDPQMFYVSIFGEPNDTGFWGWRFEGHHISINYAVANGRIIAPTPTFFGANPAESPLGTVGSLRPLGGVEDIARELLHNLSEEQRTSVLISPIAPPDIVTANRPQIIEDALPLPTPLLFGWEMTGEEREKIDKRWRDLGFNEEQQQAVRYSHTARGLAASAMSASQRQVLDALIQEYIKRMPDEIAEIESSMYRGEGLNDVHFAWAGGIERRQPHYYRLQGPRFLVEYDNTQDNANHVHTVWRDPLNDFGANLLAQHYHESHSHAH